MFVVLDGEVDISLPAALRKRRLLQRCSNFRKAPYFALHKGIAIGFLKAIGFRNKPKRTIFLLLVW